MADSLTFCAHMKIVTGVNSRITCVDKSFLRNDSLASLIKWVMELIDSKEWRMVFLHVVGDGYKFDLYPFAVDMGGMSPLPDEIVNSTISEVLDRAMNDHDQDGFIDNNDPDAERERAHQEACDGVFAFMNGIEEVDSDDDDHFIYEDP